MSRALADNLSLLELQGLVKSTLADRLSLSYWVIAEVNDLKVNASGHCYLELVQKDEQSAFIQAKMAATIWSYSYRMIRSFFETTTGQLLAPGIKVLVKGAVQYHEVYGISLNITDIEPTFTVGELELQRRKTVQQLISDGIFDMNRELELPVLTQRIAVVTSPTAAGYQDFMNHLQNNAYSYYFRTTLFPALVQGKEAEKSLLEAVDSVFNRAEEFDVLVLIRGGGATSDLLCFDSYRLASHLAQLPIPVLTGIGHDKDESVADMVAHTMLKTPTAVADFLVEQMAGLERQLDGFAEDIVNQSYEYINEQNYLLNTLQQDAVLRMALLFDRERQRLTLSVASKLENLVANRLQEEEYIIGLLEQKVEASNPQRILQKGYAIVTRNGQRVSDSMSVSSGNNLKVHLTNGSIDTKVI